MIIETPDGRIDTENCSRKLLKEMIADPTLDPIEKRKVIEAYRVGFDAALGKFLAEWSDLSPSKSRSLLKLYGWSMRRWWKDIIRRLQL